MKPGDLVTTTGATQLWGPDPRGVLPIREGETLLILALTSPGHARVLAPTGVWTTWTARLAVV